MVQRWTAVTRTAAGLQVLELLAGRETGARFESHQSWEEIGGAWFFLEQVQI